jgi:uncharacterized protein (DUF1330 family)
MSAYVIGHMTVHDPDGYGRYTARVPGTLAPHGGEFVVRGGPTTVVEGDLPHARHVVIRFPDRAAAEAWYNSAAYQEIVPVRQAHATGVLMIVDGHSP